MNESRPMRGVSVTDGRMTVEGVAGRFVQGIGRHLRLSASDLRLIGGFASQDGRLREDARIVGRAHLLSDSLRRAGFDDEAGAIALTIRPLSASNEARMLLMLGFREADDADGEFFADAFVAPVVFDALKGDMLSGAAQRLSLSATTSLWVREAEREAASGVPLTWHLGLDSDGQTSAPARGLVDTLDWDAGPIETLAAEPVADEEQDTTADQLGRINWSLKQLLLILVFLMIIIALK
ncbi:hypothetical protein [Bosea lathyri]|nr:hypothetical protein [Bosea lathyri]